MSLVSEIVYRSVTTRDALRRQLLHRQTPPATEINSLFDAWESLRELVKRYDPALRGRLSDLLTVNQELARIFRNPNLTVEEFDRRAKELDAALGKVMGTSMLADDSEIVIVPGGFEYRGATIPLAGKPLQVLRRFVESRTKRLTADALIRSVWEGNANEQNVKDAIGDVRDALRKALRLAGVKRKSDPLPCVDWGPELAWMLEMP